VERRSDPQRGPPELLRDGGEGGRAADGVRDVAVELLDAGDAQRATLAFRDALALWRGRALSDVADLDFARPEITRLEELRLAAVEARIEADLALGRHSELVGELEAGGEARHNEVLVAVEVLRWLVFGVALNALMESALPGDADERDARPSAVLPPER